MIGNLLHSPIPEVGSYRAGGDSAGGSEECVREAGLEVLLEKARSGRFFLANLLGIGVGRTERKTLRPTAQSGVLEPRSPWRKKILGRREKCSQPLSLAGGAQAPRLQRRARTRTAATCNAGPKGLRPSWGREKSTGGWKKQDRGLSRNAQGRAGPARSFSLFCSLRPSGSSSEAPKPQT